MFVLQECSVCFEDFDNERSPHSIPCGHVFCRPCLESLASTPNCPNCRTVYTIDSVRKVVCAQHDANETSSNESEAETLMWQAIRSSIETPNEYEQRKTLVKHNSPQSIHDAGMSAHLLIALDVLRILVKVEQSNQSLKEKVDTARAVEESLCDRISMLEAQLSAKTGETRTNSHEIQLLLAQVRAIQTSVQLIKTDTSAIVNQLNTEPRTPVPPPTPVTPDVSPAHTLRLPTSKPSLLRKPSPPTPTSSRAGPPPQYAQQAPVQSPQEEHFLPNAKKPPVPGSGSPPKQLASPPMTPAAQGKTLYAPSSPMTRWGSTRREDAPVPPVPQSPRTPVASSSAIPRSPQVEHFKAMPTPTSGASAGNSFHTLRSPISPSMPVFSMPVPSFPSPFTSTATPDPTPTPPTVAQPPKPVLKRRVTTMHSYTAASSTELSFGPNQPLHLEPESDVSPGKDWVWCRNDEGAVGYAPRSYLKVE